MGELLKRMKAATSPASRDCSVGLLLQDPDIGEDLQAALDLHPAITYATMSRELATMGIEMRRGTLSRHNKGECKCPRSGPSNG